MVWVILGSVYNAETHTITNGRVIHVSDIRSLTKYVAKKNPKFMVLVLKTMTMIPFQHELYGTHAINIRSANTKYRFNSNSELMMRAKR